LSFSGVRTMSSSTSAPARSEILRGSDATRLGLARLDSDLRRSPYATGGFTDPRLVDPTLEKAFEAAVESGRAQARADGYQQGYHEGVAAAQREKEAALQAELATLRQSEQQRQEALDRAVGLLERAAESLATRQAAALHDVEDVVLNAAFDLATTLLGRELEVAPAPVLDAIRRALTVLPGDVPVTVSVHPLDVAVLGNLAEVTAGRVVRIVTDADVEPGSCVADGGAAHVDASLGAAIDRVRQVLSR
jgi:flagellar assembly protein FliH